VTPVNTAPIVTSVELTMNEEHITVVSDLRGFVKDPDSSSFTFVADGALPAGASLGSDGAYRLDLGGYDFLAAGEQVLVSLKYHVSDGVIDSNPATFGIWVTGINDAPLIGGVGGTLSVAENAAPAAVAPGATVSDIDSANFNHGRLTVSLTANGTREDQLSILTDGDIGLSGANVTFGGTVIGTWSGGNNGRDLVIDFTSDSATAAAAQALVQHIAYATTAESALDRSIGFTLTDGDGRALGGKDTATASAGVHVTLTNDAPFIPTLLTTASEGEVVSFDLATASLVRDNDSSSFTWALVGLPPAGLSLSADGKLLVDLSGYDALAAGEQAQFTAAYQVSDGLSDSNIAPLILTVLGVNDAPVLGDMGGTLDWSLRDGAKVIDGAVALSDIDSKDFNDGKLVVSMAGGIGSADHLGIENQGTGAGQIGVAGSNVTYEGTVIGTWGTTGGNLVVNFATSGVSPEAVQALIEHITYSSGVTLVGKPDRTVTFSLTDGDGTAGKGTDTGTATVTIYGVNAPPIINGMSIGVVKEDDPQFAVASGQLGINDPDPGEAKFIPLATNGQHGTFTINEAGIWEYHLNTADPAVNALNETDSLADGFYVTSADYSVSVPVLITILGHNDAPVLAGKNLGTVADTAHGLTFKLSDSLVTDPDDTSFTWTAASTLPAGITLDTDGTLHVEAQYNYGYLQPGQTASLAFDLRVSDGQASSNTATFNLTVAGTNDAPLLNGQELIRGGLSEDAAGMTVQLTNFYIYDPDSANFTWKAGSTLPAGISIDADGLLHLDLAGHYDDIESGTSRLIDIDLQVNDGTSDSNVSNFWIWINGESEAPVIGGMGGTLGYDPADGAKVIDDSVTVFDLDTTDFDGGSLTVALTANGAPGDILGIANEGAGAGQIGVSGSTVTYGGAAIGTFSGGTNGSDLVVNFAGTVTTDAAKALIEHITYSSGGANVLGTPDKTVTFTLSDGSGSGSATAIIDPNVAPLLNGQELIRGGLSEDAVGVTVQLTNFYIYDPDSANFTWKAGSTLPAGISIDADGLLHLDLAGHYDDIESGASRLIDIDLQVNDGTSDSNVSNFWIWINGESEAPVIGGMGGTLDYSAGDGAKVIDNAVTVFDLDTTDFDGGSLTVALAANGGPGDILGIANEGTGAGQIGVSGATLTYGGATIGTFSGGANGSDLVINFAGTVTTDAAKALIEHITYSSGGASLLGAPDKIVTFGLSDAANTGTASATIHGVNAVPTIGGTAAGSVEEDNPQRATASGLLTISDPDPGEAKFIPAILDGQYGTFILQDTGAWQYFLRQDDPAVNALKDGDSVIDGFNVVSSDHSAIPSVSIVVQGHNDAPVAADDLVVASNGRAGFELPTWALLANDSDPDSANLSVTHVDVVGSSLHGVTGPIGGDLVVFTNGGIGQFTYQANDGSVAGAAATVTVVDQIPGQVLGTAAHEILVSGQRGERIDGQGGSDLIFAGGGDDTLIFHAGDTAQGGADSVSLGGGLGAVGGRGDVLAIDFDVDFTALDLSRFQGIETLSLVNTESGGSGVQSLTISAANVLSLSDHTITPGGVFTEHAAIRVDADSVDQLYLSISKDGGSWSDTGVNLGGYQVYAHDAGAGADAYVMVATANTGNVHLNQDA
jgi:VCBS repeat-containing protein